MDLFLYHYQGLFYNIVFLVLIVRIVINGIIYYKIDSNIIQANIPYWWTLTQFSEAEKEEIRKKRPDIKDFSKDGSQTGKMEFVYFMLTFWWPIEYKEENKIVRLKKTANILNIIFIVLVGITMWLVLHMQEINVTYENVKREWTFIL